MHDVRSWAESRNCRTSNPLPEGAAPPRACRRCYRGCRLHRRQHCHPVQVRARRPAAPRGGRRRRLLSLRRPRCAPRGPRGRGGPGAGCGRGHRHGRHAPHRAAQAWRRASTACRRRRRGAPRGACARPRGPRARAPPAVGGGLCGAKIVPRAPLPPVRGDQRPRGSRAAEARGSGTRRRAAQGGRKAAASRAGVAQRATQRWGRASSDGSEGKEASAECTKAPGTPG